MYNIKKAVSRLEFAPKIDEIKVTDIKHGLGMFTPKPEKDVSFAKLREALKKAGYTLGSAEIIVSGTLEKEGDTWSVVTATQPFLLRGDNLANLLKGTAEGAHIEIAGDWRTEEKAGKAAEVITPKSAHALTASTGIPRQRLRWMSAEPHIPEGGFTASSLFAPIHTTSPGLTVYKGGAITSRLSFTSQHLGRLKVERNDLVIDASYTPTSRLQLEAELPIEHVSTVTQGITSPPDNGQSRIGNLTFWGKYRFYRKVAEWGDRQAALRFGLEAPTGQTKTPSVADPGLQPYVRQQLSAINNGVAGHTEVTYSQAKGRFIYGGDIAGVLRGERNGYRLGHEARVNTDLEYVLLPVNYQQPGHELFVLLESTLIHRGQGRLNGQSVAGSSYTAFYLAPGLQYTVSPRVVLEASYQHLIGQSASSLALRSDRSLLIGIRLLY